MNKPKFTGPKKNHTAMWVVVWTDQAKDYNGMITRIRKLDSRGKWRWDFIEEDTWDRCSPCWLKREVYGKDGWRMELARMKRYDRGVRKAIFIGYVRDSE